MQLIEKFAKKNYFLKKERQITGINNTESEKANKQYTLLSLSKV